MYKVVFQLEFSVLLYLQMNAALLSIQIVVSIFYPFQSMRQEMVERTIWVYPMLNRNWDEIEIVPAVACNTRTPVSIIIRVSTCSAQSAEEFYCFPTNQSIIIVML